MIVSNFRLHSLPSFLSSFVHFIVLHTISLPLRTLVTWLLYALFNFSSGFCCHIPVLSINVTKN
ncbi:hypothetical protein BX666DRAFT_1968707 [Dichotomocladium elegans]|nr:hypothetical protein BX666DRAFT_1968707 [Dichotomocladium elegans]